MSLFFRYYLNKKERMEKCNRSFENNSIKQLYLQEKYLFVLSNSIQIHIGLQLVHLNNLKRSSCISYVL
jgi:hypothetical protein